ncbi:MAG: hypothetical protein IJK74_08415 [Bacteroidales bacterium]|nr:hypothetical protein [Bacteroidales bacterium]
MESVRSLIIAFAITFIGITAAAQENPSGFQKHRRDMLDIHYARLSSGTDLNSQIGAAAIFGKQRTPVYYQGWGIGVTYVWCGAAPNENDFVIPAFSEFRFNFSRNETPLFCNMRVGAAVDTNGGFGPLLSLGLGKEFKAGNSRFSAFVRGDVTALVPLYGLAGIAVGVCFDL